MGLLKDLILELCALPMSYMHFFKNEFGHLSTANEFLTENPHVVCGFWLK